MRWSSKPIIVSAGLTSVAAIAALLLWTGTDVVGAQSCSAPTPLRFQIASKITRSELGFTQGLEYRAGQLYESTGKVGGSTRLNVISMTGQVRPLADRGTAVFGEGLTILNGEIFQLTWQDHQVFVYDLDGKLKRTMRNPRDGWGLTNDGENLIFSDGGPSFYYADPKTFAIKRTVKLRWKSPEDIEGLNELELVHGRVYGNIFMSWSMVRFDPASGCIDGVADLRNLRDAMSPDEKEQIERDSNNVLNGIAYNDASGLFYLTGKRWKVIFSGRFITAQ
jgi:glutamine cyclotransferase